MTQGLILLGLFVVVFMMLRGFELGFQLVGSLIYYGFTFIIMGLGFMLGVGFAIYLISLMIFG